MSPRRQHGPRYANLQHPKNTAEYFKHFLANGRHVPNHTRDHAPPPQHVPQYPAWPGATRRPNSKRQQHQHVPHQRQKIHGPGAHPSQRNANPACTKRPPPGQFSLMRAAEGPILTRAGVELAPQFSILNEMLFPSLPMVIKSPPAPTPGAKGYHDECKVGYLVTSQLDSAIACGSIMGCSPQMAQLMDLTPKDMIGRTLFGFLADHWSKIVNNGECGKFVCHDPFRLVSKPAGRVVLQGDNTHVAFAYRQDPLKLGPLELIVWSFAQIDPLAFTDKSDERTSYDSEIVSRLSPFTQIDTEAYTPTTDAKRANLALNSWAILQVWKYFRCTYSQVSAGYFQFFAIENLDLIGIIRKMDEYLRSKLAVVMQQLNIPIGKGGRPTIDSAELPSGGAKSATPEEQAFLRHYLAVSFDNFLDDNPEFRRVLTMSLGPWGPEFNDALTAPKCAQGVPLDPIAKYLGDNLYLADSLPCHGNRMRQEIDDLLEAYGTANEDYWVLRTRNFKMSDVFNEKTKEVGESFGIVVADSFLVFRPRQYERARLMFQLAALHLDGDISQDGIHRTANNRVPRMGFCTCMTLIETFKDQAPIVFGGSERLDRKVAQWNELFKGAKPTSKKLEIDSLMEAQRPIDDIIV